MILTLINEHIYSERVFPMNFLRPLMKTRITQSSDFQRLSFRSVFDNYFKWMWLFVYGEKTCSSSICTISKESVWKVSELRQRRRTDDIEETMVRISPPALFQTLVIRSVRDTFSAFLGFGFLFSITFTIVHLIKWWLSETFLAKSSH